MSNSTSHNSPLVVSNYTLTAFLSFAIVFCLFALFSTCHGDYHPPKASHHEAVGHEVKPAH